MEKASLECIRLMLEITKAERNDECPKTLITNPRFSEIWDQVHIYIYDFILITFLIFSLYWAFAGKVLEMEPCRSPGEEWCRNQLNIATLERRDIARKP